MSAFLLVAALLSGTVEDSAGRPLAGATIEVASVRSVRSSTDGRFSLDLPPGEYQVRFAHPGFRGETRRMRAGELVVVRLQPVVEETITVSGIRADAVTPVTKTDIDRHSIERNYHQQDIPLLMRDAPSIHAYAESGVGGSGYSYITMRGMSPTRINFTLDGVPLADSEDMATYFADFPDLAHSLQSIQIQRSAGTSTVGSASFAGSVNLQSIDLSQTESAHARVAGGSFGNRFGTVGYQSGELPGGFALYTRASWNESDGFRDSSGIRQRNLFVSAAKQTGTSQIKLTGFTGHEWQQLSFYATDAGTLETDLRANPLQPEEKDSFGYDLAQLQYLRALGDDTNMTASVYYQRGYGWYRLFDDGFARTGLRQYGLDGLLLGSMVTLERRAGPFTANYGLHVNRFEREHTRDLVDGARDYFNYGVKSEANAFAKVSYDRGAMHLYGDAQLRHAGFSYHGEVDIEPIDWTFFNPRLGVRYALSPRASVYASTGYSTREPARNDMFFGEDNASVAHDLRAVRPERVLNVEAGIDITMSRLALAANVYSMEFRNEIALTGELSEIGLPLRRNVDRSYRRGIELDATAQATQSVRLRTTANVSRNRIATWLTYRNVEPLLTPPVLLNQAIEYTPSPRFGAGLVARYVAESYLDNANDEALVTPSYVVVDGNVSISLGRLLSAGDPRLSVQVNNLFDNDRIYASGYAFDGVPYYFPQATRNFVVMLDFRL